MADAVATQIIQDGPKEAVFKFTNVSDGTGESGVVKVDVSALTPDPMTGKACSSATIQYITYSTIGMGVKIFFDATADVLAWEMPADDARTFNFFEFTGIPNNAGAGKTGDILFSTVNATAGNSYAVLLKVLKNYD